MPNRPPCHINVCCWLLLLAPTAMAERDLTVLSLSTQAQQQQQALIERHGRNCSTTWHQRCADMLLDLDLNQIKHCIIINSERANAYALANGNLILTQGLIQATRNPDQLAHVLAHEHAHLVLNHHQQTAELLQNPPTFFTKTKIKKHHRRIELAADAHADAHLLKHQMDPKQINHYLLRLDPDTQKRSVSHPRLSQRLDATNLPSEEIDPEWLGDMVLFDCE